MKGLRKVSAVENIMQLLYFILYFYNENPGEEKRYPENVFLA